VKDTFLAIVNPAAGGGRCGRLAPQALQDLRAAGIAIEATTTSGPGGAAEIVRNAYSNGYRNFLAVGGDGTSFEIINGLFPSALGGDTPTLGFLPLGTGNSFLRDFTDKGAEYAREALIQGRRRSCDVLKLTHRDGTMFYMNLLSIGFPADVAALTNRRFKSFGELGYLAGILVCLARLRRTSFPLQADGDAERDTRRCLFLTFNNSQYTGGKMRIAPQANSADGLIEFVRWGPIGRVGLLANLHRLYDGTHVNHPLASRRAVRRVDFDLTAPVDVMVDGEVARVHCQTLEVLPGALNVVA
jgi:diacylglycerol kinase (ATP)